MTRIALIYLLAAGSLVAASRADVPIRVRRAVASGITSGLATSTSVGTGTVTVSTSVPSPTAALNQTLPSQAPLAPKQPWCPSEIFCAGSLLQTVNIAQLYGDSKTFVDKPTFGRSNTTLTDFVALGPVGGDFTNITYGALQTYVENDFKGEGLELIATTLNNTSTPAFLNPKTIPDRLVRAWAGVVHSYWDQLIRNTDQSQLCDGVKCESSLIPLNHTFVVPGGRFREQYYWDSYWIVEGLLQSELYSIANSTLQNFMDELETIGFIPNGGRIYYLNRSQPPLFMKMLYAYVNATKDVTILNRALPLAEVELNWWHTNRTINVTSPYTNKTWAVSRYAVVNTAPRPEGYFEDYSAANGADLTVPYTEAEKQDLYAELASGAESGLDYTARWLKNPYLGNITNTTPALRTLNVRNTIPVDLNSILYNYHILLADLHDLHHTKSSTAASQAHRKTAATLKSAILDLFWDPSKFAFYDFNATAHARGTLFSAAHFYPFWNGIIPTEVAKSETGAQKAFSALRLILTRYNGTIPGTFLITGLQWDAPNTWPPHQFIALEALKALPANVTRSALPPLSSNITSFSLVPAGQLGLNESQLPAQPIEGGGESTGDINYLGATVYNGGNATRGEGWAAALGRELANRYISSAFCSWYATGGSIPGILTQLPPAELNVTFSNVNSTGHMYEKFSAFDIDSSGSGGEYTVQAGFGWTNGVVLYLASKFGTVLATPNCPAISVNGTGNVTAAYFTGRRRSPVWSTPA